MPLLIVLGIGVAVISAIGYTYQARLASQSQTAGADDPQRPEPANATPLFGNAPVSGVIATAQPAPAPRPANQPAVPSDAWQPAGNPVSDMERRAWEQYQQELGRLEQARQAAWQSALEAPTTINRSRQQGASAPGAAGLLAAAYPSQPPGLGLGAGAETDPNSQQAKREFLDQTPPASDYLQGTRTAPLSPYEVKAGTVIPAVMVSGVHSDLPGQLVAQVTENVYDTATGRYCLIPQGAKLIGTYDHQVTMGQERVLVAWTRILYPDASSLDLGRMPGADQGGTAGFHDQVNHHYGRTFGHALLLSLLSAGIQLSQPQARPGDVYSSQQVIAGALGQQLGVLGMETVRQQLKLAPALEIRPGYRFNVMVTQDLILRPWPPR